MNPKKSIMSRYATKIVNSNYYGTINVTGTDNTNGIIYVPYIMSSPIEPIIIQAPTPEEVRLERKKKLDRIFKDNI